MTLEEFVSARFDSLLERQPDSDVDVARAALEDAAATFGEAALHAAMCAGSLPLAALIELSRGMSREAVAMKFAQIGQGRAH